MFVKFLAEGEIRKDEDEIFSLVSLLHSEIDSISSISAINKKYEYIKQTDQVLKQIDSIAIRIKEQDVYTDIDIDKRLNSIHNIINHTIILVETLNDTVSINNLVIEKSYMVTTEEMNIQELPLSNERNLSFMLRIYDDGLRDKAKAIFIVDKSNVGIAYQYKKKQNHFVLPAPSQHIDNSYCTHLIYQTSLLSCSLTLLYYHSQTVLQSFQSGLIQEYHLYWPREQVYRTFVIP